MATGVDTRYDIGLARDCTTYAGVHLGIRNFEQALAIANPATVQYESKLNGLYFNGSTFHIGDAITYDVGGNRYSTQGAALLEFYWNQNFINPTT